MCYLRLFIGNIFIISFTIRCRFSFSECFESEVFIIENLITRCIREEKFTSIKFGLLFWRLREEIIWFISECNSFSLVNSLLATESTSTFETHCCTNTTKSKFAEWGII